jgi:dTDP-4-amino-4,6-dideoxygalactose transaminase
VMKVPFGDLRRQYISMKGEIDEAVGRVLARGWFILGEELETFEQRFARWCGSKHAIGVGSGTEALHLALLASGVEHDDEVITVSNTAVPTVSAISSASAKPIFVDIDQTSYNIDVNQVEAAITPRTRVILPVHLYGQAADMDPLLAVARRYKLKVVEDCAQAHGTEYKGKQAGAFGDAGCFSFYPSKNLGAFGDAGMVVTNDEEIALKVRVLRNYGQERRYYHRTIGFNSRLDEIQAAILNVKLSHIDRWNARRREIATLYDRELKSDTVVKPTQMEYGKHAYHLYVIRDKRRDELQKFLGEKGVTTLIHYPIPVHMQQAYRGLGIAEGMLPATEQHSREVLSLPMFPELEDREVEYVCQLVKRFATS